MILNIVVSKLKHKNVNKHKDRDTFDLQNIKSGTLFLYFDNFYSLNLEDNIVFYLSLLAIF